MANPLECVASKSAEGRGSIASTHIDGIGGMAKVVDAKFGARLMRANTVARRGWKPKTRGRKRIREGLVGKSG